jgi:hypothetical protein
MDATRTAIQPKTYTVKFAGRTCAECGGSLAIGDTVIYRDIGNGPEPVHADADGHVMEAPR